MAKLSGGRQLAKINRQDSSQGSLLARMIAAHNHMAEQLGVDPVGQSSAPPPPNSVSVTVTGEQAHIRVKDNSPTNRARTYFSEIHTDANFTTPKMVVQHGATRDAQVALPTLNSDGVMQQYFVRTFSQDQGSPPSTPTPYPTYVTMDVAGTTQGDLPASAGSGTSSAQGTQAAQGFGVYPTRKATGVKRESLP